jgi:curli biogenesis system outer membrane secretion channel CsgG
VAREKIKCYNVNLLSFSPQFRLSLARGCYDKAVMKRFLFLLSIMMLVTACAPAATTASNVANTATDAVNNATSPSNDVSFDLEPIPQAERWIIAVPNFEVGTSGVKIGEADLSQEGDEFFKELGSGVADIFVTEAFRSNQFRITERAQIDKVLLEQDLATSGRIDPGTAAEVGQITGAELIVVGSVTEFGVTTTGGGGKVLGIFGGSAETVTANIAVDIRVVDAKTAEIIAIGVGRDSRSQTNVQIDILNVIRGLQAGQSGTTIVDIAVRNAIRKAINEAAVSLPRKSL